MKRLEKGSDFSRIFILSHIWDQRTRSGNTALEAHCSKLYWLRVHFLFQKTNCHKSLLLDDFFHIRIREKVVCGQICTVGRMEDHFSVIFFWSRACTSAAVSEASIDLSWTLVSFVQCEHLLINVTPSSYSPYWLSNCEGPSEWTEWPFHIKNKRSPLASLSILRHVAWMAVRLLFLPELTIASWLGCNNTFITRPFSDYIVEPIFIFGQLIPSNFANLYLLILISCVSNCGTLLVHIHE